MSNEVIEKVKANKHLIPEHMIDGLVMYLQYGKTINHGSFLTAVLSNDLVGAFDKADYKNAAMMQGWAEMMHNVLPSDAWGSKEKFLSWKGFVVAQL